jgi:hypothetical protein
MVAAAVASAITVVVFLPALASATDHVVGDGYGWTLGFDYAAWAKTKQFTVGDTLGNCKSPMPKALRVCVLYAALYMHLNCPSLLQRSSTALAPTTWWR